MGDDEFWSLTPREFDALTRAWGQKQKRLDSRFGLVAAILANVNRRKGSKRWKVSDFVGKYTDERPRTDEEVWGKVDTAMRALGGR